MTGKAHRQRCETCGNHTEKGSCLVATSAVMSIVKDASHFSNGEGIYINQSERDLIAIIGCASHTSASDQRTELEDLCNIDLTHYVWGEMEGEDVSQCRGKDCNYCGRYNALLQEGRK